MNRRTFISHSAGLAISLMAAGPTLPGITAKPRSRNFEVAIIGAGLFGSAAARYLSERSDGIALIGPGEPRNHRDHRGVFASHYDDTRLIRVVDPDLVWATMAKRTVARFRELERVAGIEFYNECGYMMVAPGGFGNEWFDFNAMQRVANDLAVALDVLEDTELKERFPELQFTPNSSGLLQSQAAGYMNPRHLVSAQQKVAIEQGTTLITEEVVELKSGLGQVEMITRSGDRLHANRVLIATGASTNACNLLKQRLDTQVRAAMIMLAEVPNNTQLDIPTILYSKTDGKQPFWGLLMPPVTYGDGRRYVKTMDGYYGPKPLESYDEIGSWCRSEGHQGHHWVLKQALAEVVPSFRVLSYHFNPCLILDTATHYPYIDMVDERIGVVIGGNGKAAKSSDEIGRLAAEMMGSGSWSDSASLPASVFAAKFMPS